MSAPFFFLSFRLEDAIRDYIARNASIDATVNLYTTADAVGGDREDIRLPFVYVKVTGAKPHADAGDAVMGNAWQDITVEVAIATQSKDNDALGRTVRQDHAGVAGAVLEVFYQTDVRDLINGIARGVQVNQMDLPEYATEPMERGYMTTLTFAATCYAIDNEV